MIAVVELERPIETPNNNSYGFYPKDLEEASKYFGEFLVDWRDAYQLLREKGILVLAGGEYRLTDAGASLAERYRRDRPPITSLCSANDRRPSNSVRSTCRREMNASIAAPSRSQLETQPYTTLTDAA